MYVIIILKMLTYDTPTQYYVILHQCLRSQHRVLHPALHSSEAECNMKCMLLSIYSHHYYAGIPYGWGWIKHSLLSSFLRSFCLFLNNQSLWSDTILYQGYIQPDHNAFQSWTVTNMKSMCPEGFILYAMSLLLLLLLLLLPLTFCLLPRVSSQYDPGNPFRSQRKLN